MIPLGLLGSSHVTTTELFVIDSEETFRGALGTKKEIKTMDHMKNLVCYLLHLSLLLQ